MLMHILLQTQYKQSMILSLVNKVQQMSQMLEVPLDNSFHVIMLECYVCLKIKQLSDGL